MSSSVEDQISNETNEDRFLEFDKLINTESTLIDLDFNDKNNVSKEERHTLDEVKTEEQSIIYRSTIQLTTSTEPSTSKKAKYLDIMSSSDSNMNASLPVTSEVWALASMRNVDPNRAFSSKPPQESNTESLEKNVTVGSLLDWSEITTSSNSTDNVPQTSKKPEVLDLTEATAEHREIKVSTEINTPATDSTTSDDLEETTTEFFSTTDEPMTFFETSTSTDDDENLDLDVFKRTISKVPDDLATTFSPLVEDPPSTTVLLPTTTTPNFNEETKGTTHKASKSISIRVVPTEETVRNEAISMPNINLEIFDDDKFKYSTIIPEDNENYGQINDTTKLIMEEVSGAENGSNNVIIISVSVCVVIFVLLGVGGFVSSRFLL